MATQNLTMVKGNTATMGIVLEDLNTDLVSADFTCKNDKNGEIIFQKTLGNGIEKRETNIYSLRIAPEDTANIEAKDYFYSFTISANGDIFTFLRGTLTVLDKA